MRPPHRGFVQVAFSVTSRIAAPRELKLLKTPFSRSYENSSLIGCVLREALIGDFRVTNVVQLLHDINGL
jgi:hypothetical protein